MHCPQCGHSNDDEYAFCKKCGASLGRDDAESAPATRPPVIESPSPHAEVSAATPAGPYASTAAMTPTASAPAGQATEYAGFWWRFLAMFIDGFVTAVPNFFISFAAQMVGVFAVLGSGQNEDVAAVVGGIFGLLGALLTVLISWLYEAGMVSSRYQATLGKMAVGIVVTDMNGGRISFGRATGRYFGKLLSAATLFIGYLMQPFTDRRQTLHDMLAG
ncbi:MAG: RDD family protein [Acidobacteria bacterium]|nr:RDD family protein [Acidobacteriota bacterium]